MIINIRGTSGSGKTHLVREVMSRYQGSKMRVREDGRKQPIGYLLQRPGEIKGLAVIGHYETVCGGCDTIAKMERIFELVRFSASHGHDVIFEGLLISADVNRHVTLYEWARGEDIPMEVVALTTPLQLCLDSVNARRRAKNPDKPDVNPKNTESKHRGVAKSLERLRAAGVPVFEGDRDEALTHIVEVLGL